MALQVAPSPMSPAPWRLVTSPAVHVGVRPAALVSPEERAAAATIQVTLNVL